MNDCKTCQFFENIRELIVEPQLVIDYSNEWMKHLFEKHPLENRLLEDLGRNYQAEL